ncbi:MAG: hypothetical protein M4579_002167 [Chaenotheca gracillima]|nr:MAG: hypothetical protein M4579_002167 [Chaenotheca gracillima]
MSARGEDPSSAGISQPGVDPRSVPRLGEGFAETEPKDAGDESTPVAKTSKRRLFGFGRKKDEENDKTKKKAAAQQPSSGAGLKSSPLPRVPSNSDTQALSSPQRSTHPYGAAAPGIPGSPRQLPTSSSPALPSPASSQIFERNVQENSTVAPTSPAIPGHIQTDDHIPPVLEASSIAITDGHLNPDQVEIVTHTAHQPASLGVAGGGADEHIHATQPTPTLAQSLREDSPPAHFHHPPSAIAEHDDTASNYGTLDANDIRRLSFISFADVVQAEHTEHSSSRDSVHMAGLSSTSPPLAPTSAVNRSPSPVRSPISSYPLTAGHTTHSPPASANASVKGFEAGSPGRGSTRGPGSPVSATSVPVGGANELTIETMSQALRKTGSGDIGAAARSQPLSAVSAEDGVPDRPWAT